MATAAEIIASVLLFNYYHESGEAEQGAKEVLDALDRAGMVVIDRPVIDASTMVPAHEPVRATDPVSSHRTAPYRPRRGSMAERMLLAHGDALFGSLPYQGFTNYEIALAIGVEPYSSGCPHKRHGELDDNGFLEKFHHPDGREYTRKAPKRTGKGSEDQVVRVLVAEGVALYLELKKRRDR